MSATSFSRSQHDDQNAPLRAATQAVRERFEIRQSNDWLMIPLLWLLRHATVMGDCDLLGQIVVREFQ